MKEQFEKPELNKIFFGEVEIIATSAGNGVGNTGDGTGETSEVD